MLKNKWVFLLFFVIFGTSVCFERCSFGADFKDILLGDDRPGGYGAVCWHGKPVSEGNKSYVQVTDYPVPKDRSVASFYPECGDVNRKAIAVVGTRGQTLDTFLRQKIAQGIAYDYAIDEGGLYRLFPEAFSMTAHASVGYDSSHLVMKVAMVSNHQNIAGDQVENASLKRLFDKGGIERVIHLSDLAQREQCVRLARQAHDQAAENVQRMRESLGEQHIFFSNDEDRLANAEADLKRCEEELHTLIFGHSL
ncbi:hypothetical protein EIL50_04605 [bacterium NHP-B]|nr:hypothetical protein EIL50_04605 [bacterium NHP-B]